MGNPRYTYSERKLQIIKLLISYFDLTKEAPTHETIAKHLGVSKVMAGHLLYRMEKEGIVENRGWQVCPVKRKRTSSPVNGGAR